MKVATYRSRTGGAAIPDLAVHMERLLFAEFTRNQGCPRRSRTEPPRRLNREPGVEADAAMV
ncbi:hypothetical protein ACCC97_19055, partial [Variovorax sp. Varisp85]